MALTVDFVFMVCTMFVGLIALILVPLAWLPSALLVALTPLWEMEVTECKVNPGGDGERVGTWSFSFYDGGVCKGATEATRRCLLFTDSELWDDMDAENTVRHYPTALLSSTTYWISAKWLTMAAVIFVLAYVVSFLLMARGQPKLGLWLQGFSLVASCPLYYFVRQRFWHMLSPRAWSTWYFRGCALQLRPRAASWALGFLSTSQMALLALAVVVLVAYSLWRCLGDGRSGLMPLPEEVAGSSSGSGKDSKLPAMGEASPLLPAGGTSGGALAAPWLPSAPVGGSVAPPLYPEAKRVLVLMSATGGGHLTSAQAISTALRQLFGDERVQIEILDIWAKYASWPFTGIVNHYKIFSRHPWLWKLSYDFTQFPVTRLLSEAISDITSFAAFRRAIFERDPDLVLSVHPLCQSMPVRIVAELNRCRYQRDPRCRRLPVVFATCITDLISCHDCWFHPAADIIFAPTDEVRRLGLSNGSGLLDRRLRVHGLPIRPVFWTPSNLSRKEVREKLGLDPQRRTVLVVGGGDGMGSVREQADAIVRRLGGPDILSGTQQVVVICGTNEALRAQLVSMRDSGTWSGDVAVMILGFTRAMDEFMLAADLLVTKAGPGTICEAMIVGLPMVLSSFLPGQETGNVTYVVDNQLGYFEAEPRRIADRVAQLLVDDALLQEMASRARTLANPQATLAIGRDIGAICFRTGETIPFLESPEEPDMNV